MENRIAESLLFRSRGNQDSGKVSFIELFFDLIFVFAVTQLSHSFLENFTVEGAVRLVLITMAVWWAWIFTAWVINWLNPDSKPVKLMLIALMLLGLIMSSSITDAFGHTGLYFGIAYTLFQVGRTAYTVWILRKGPAELRVNFIRILGWLLLSGVFWITGGIVDDSWRLALWIPALVIEYISPSLGFWMPRIGRSSTNVWNVEGSHLAERCGLFIIIALGESILVTGATFAKMEWNPTTLGSFVLSFASTVSMWWIYFESMAKTGHHYIAHSSDPGRVARSAYTYTHLLLVAGIILSAVADELLLSHPFGHIDAKTAAVILIAPGLYLLGNVLFMRIVAQVVPLPYLIGLIALAALSFIAMALSPFVLYAATAIVLVTVSLWGGVYSDRLCSTVPGPAHKKNA
ncbi:low temperature requirement protein A [Paenibacillus oenotherae]|uniref:Low temperature requirement protein A n=1 Tax=Paenibacillus oenotherae TaxID=1435645 RepID=A0ABS7D6C6_9BACL|nr:low temperature requirement protein A [Paenibacillus oenotherae]MBW7475492.1 low temperature requirement protein A [Paenibacillus oenotherae]